MTPETQEKLKAYYEKFNEGFPTMPLAMDNDDAEVQKMIDACIKHNKTAEMMGYLDDYGSDID